MPTEVYFATDRTQPKGKGKPFGNRFHSDGPQFYEVGKATVTWDEPDPKKRDWDEYTASYELLRARKPATAALVAGEVPEMHRKGVARETTGSAKVFQDLREQMLANNRDILLYIHGFANDFENAMARAAQLTDRAPGRRRVGRTL